MLRRSMLLLMGALSSMAGAAADRAISVNPVVAEAWSFSTGGPTVVSGPNKGYGLGVGYWQRSSGAKVGVGSNFITSVEFQLPESAPSRIRSASYQFSGKAGQCTGNEPVVIAVYAYAADGRANIADANLGSQVAQMSADCKESPAFSRPIDVTQIVRQLSVASGIRHVGFNIRKANNRQGPGLFNLGAGKLTVVLADQALAQPPQARVPGTAPRAAMAGAVAAPMQTQTPMPVQVPSRAAVAAVPPRQAASAIVLRRDIQRQSTQ